MPLSSVEEIDGDSEPAIRISLAEAEYFRRLSASQAFDPDDWVQYSVLADGQVFIRSENVFEAVISRDGREVLCRKVEDADQTAFESNLLNFVLSASLTLQGEEPLHATVVEVGGRAIGLLGPSGAGKSTLAASLIAKGADLITDDMLRMTFADDSLLAYPGPYRLKLFEAPGKRFLPGAMVRGYFDPLKGKHLVEPRNAMRRPRAPTPLSALFYIGNLASGQSSISTSRLAGIELARVIISSTMDFRYDKVGRLERQIEFAARLARTLPVYELSYPRKFDVMDDVASEIGRALTA